MGLVAIVQLGDEASFEAAELAIEARLDGSFEAVVGLRSASTVRVGAAVVISVGASGAARRTLRGVVAEVVRDASGTAVEMVVHPSVGLHAGERRFRVHQGVSDLEVAQKTLERTGTAFDVRVTAELVSRPCRAQIHEDDASFVRRVLGASGLALVARWDPEAAPVSIVDERGLAEPSTVHPRRHRERASDAEIEIEGVALPGDVVRLGASRDAHLVVSARVRASTESALATTAVIVPKHAALRPASPRDFVASFERATVLDGPKPAAPSRISVRFSSADANEPEAVAAVACTLSMVRAGQEVLVVFPASDRDSPVVLGSLSPTQVELSGVEGLTSEDQGGRKVVTLSAERDLHTVVKRNDETAVGGHRSTQIKGNDTEHVSGNKKASVLGQVMESIGGDRLASVLGSAVSQVGKERVIQTLGELSSSARAHRLSSQDGTTLSVGESLIHLTPDAIILQSPRILLNPGASASEHAILTGRTPERRSVLATEGEDADEERAPK